jgi:hypothetical protein
VKEMLSLPLHDRIGPLGLIPKQPRFVSFLVFQIHIFCFSFQQAELAVGSMTINSAREKVIDFTKPFRNLGISILFKVRKSDYFALYSLMSGQNKSRVINNPFISIFS